jgi:hypothetical protein
MGRWHEVPLDESASNMDTVESFCFLPLRSNGTAVLQSNNSGCRVKSIPPNYADQAVPPYNPLTDARPCHSL